MEELINEQAVEAAHTAEAENEKRRDTASTTSLKKFRDVESLEKAYGCLEAEFTKRSQRLKTLEGELSALREEKANAKNDGEKSIGSTEILTEKEATFAEKRSGDGDGAEGFYSKNPEAAYYARKIADFAESEKDLSDEKFLEKAYVKCLLDEIKSLKEQMNDEKFLTEKIGSTTIKDKIIKEYLVGVKNAPKTLRLMGGEGSIVVMPPVKPKTLAEASALVKDYIKIK